MTSFLEKLKKGMGVKNLPGEQLTKETVEEMEKEIKIEGLPEDQLSEKKVGKIAKKKSKKSKKIEEKTEDTEKKDMNYPPRTDIPFGASSFGGSHPHSKKRGIPTAKIKEKVLKEEEKIEVKEEKEVKEEPAKIKKRKGWLEPEGQLTIDLYQTDEEIIIQSAVAGVKPEELDISIENDVVTIKGNREETFEEKERNYFYQECYWGQFSREIILPVEVDTSRTQATMKEGVLTIRIPKIEREKKRKITVKQ